MVSRKREGRKLCSQRGARETGILEGVPMVSGKREGRKLCSQRRAQETGIVSFDWFNF